MGKLKEENMFFYFFFFYYFFFFFFFFFFFPLSLIIIILVPELDRILGGNGILCGRLTEICGVPGIGKTQLAMQLAVDVQIPTAFGGVGGECLYIDTEGSFSPQRTYEIAKAMQVHLTQVASTQSGDNNNNNNNNNTSGISLSQTFSQQIMHNNNNSNIHNNTLGDESEVNFSQQK